MSRPGVSRSLKPGRQAKASPMREMVTAARAAPLGTPVPQALPFGTAAAQGKLEQHMPERHSRHSALPIEECSRASTGAASLFNHSEPMQEEVCACREDRRAGGAGRPGGDRLRRQRRRRVPPAEQRRQQRCHWLRGPLPQRGCELTAACRAAAGKRLQRSARCARTRASLFPAGLLSVCCVCSLGLRTERRVEASQLRQVTHQNHEQRGP